MRTTEDLEAVAYSDWLPAGQGTAYQAGLGWIGKNNNLINPEHGSYLILGGDFDNLPLLLPDEPMESDGSCQLCIESCPLRLCNPIV